MARIYTRSGDKGTTGLADGSRLDKDSLRITAIGDIDELNSLFGMIITNIKESHTYTEMLSKLQHTLFDLGGELALPDNNVITSSQIDRIELTVDNISKSLPPLKEFILPGGNDAACYCHLARSVCRRAERATIRLAREETVNPQSLIFLNRLSDLLFVLARALARENGGSEVTWQQMQF